MSRPLIHLVAGARPNFMKVAPLWQELSSANWCAVKLVHTGQHYDESMSDVFLRQLGLPKPDHALGVGSGTHAEQTAAVMSAYEKVAVLDRPAWVVVVGDVNSTLAATISAKKLQLKVAHLEAGLRSFDRHMPEEINRVVTDALADLLWTPSPDGDANLLAEGVPPDRIERVGNIMIDTYEMMRSQIESARRFSVFGLVERQYAVVTLHRPSNVDTAESLGGLVDALERIARSVPIIFPVHPRTLAKLIDFGLVKKLSGHPSIRLTDPLGYVDFMSLVSHARLVMTDSGGVQEETTYLGIPCLTLRANTERPVTVTDGSNRLVRPEDLTGAVEKALASRGTRKQPPELWDGRTASRVAGSLRRQLGGGHD